jgi:hypothetical protein
MKIMRLMKNPFPSALDGSVLHKGRHVIKDWPEGVCR